METEVVVTRKGQTTIPAKLRKKTKSKKEQDSKSPTQKTASSSNSKNQQSTSQALEPNTQLQKK
jgi:hypothetical protein